MMEVTVLFLDQTFSSTAIGPMEVFRHAGTLWNFLTGKRQVPRFREKYPNVKWMPELMVTEDRGFYCGGGVHAALDLSLYLVERFCGHDIAVQTAKALLIETRRAWQAGFAIVPLKTEHSDDNIS